MSDTSFAAVADKRKLLEIIDDDWIEDSLSDDEIEIPKEFNVSVEEEEEEEELLNKEDTWNDLGLDDFHDDSSNPQAVAPATTTQNK